MQDPGRDAVLTAHWMRPHSTLKGRANEKARKLREAASEAARSVIAWPRLGGSGRASGDRAIRREREQDIFENLSKNCLCGERLGAGTALPSVLVCKHEVSPWLPKRTLHLQASFCFSPPSITQTNTKPSYLATLQRRRK